MIENHGCSFIRHSLVCQKLFLFPKRPVNCQKQSRMFQRANHPGKNYVQHLLAAKELYIFAAPKMTETMKNQFHKSHGGLYFKQHQQSALVSSTYFKLSISLLHFFSAISNVLKLKYEEGLGPERSIQPSVLQHA